MARPWRRRVLAAALFVTTVAGVSSAQTVVVTRAPANSTVELVVNAATVGSVTVDASGNATLAASVPALAGTGEIDARIYVDLCPDLRRVLLVERGVLEPPPASSCTRRAIDGLYLVRRATTLVVDVTEGAPSVRIRQGPAPRAWLGLEVPSDQPPAPAPAGLILFGGGGLASFRDAGAVFCGDVSECKTTGPRLAYTAGLAYWLTPFFAAEASYIRPANVTADGSGTGYRFSSDLDTHVIAAVGKLGMPIGRLRLYGQAGATYHRASATTTETIDDDMVTIDGAAQTIAGGTQTFVLRTAGWGWLFGGGVEVWVTPTLAIYAEGGRSVLKGDAADTGDARMDDRAASMLAGVRIHVGR